MPLSLQHAVCLLLIASPIGAAFADDVTDAPDRVTVLLSERGRISMQCRIIDYTGKTLKVRLKSGDDFREYQTSQVIDVQTPHSPQHQKGLDLLKQGDAAAAKASLEEALGVEVRGWVRREILAELVRCSLRQGDAATAGSRFLLLTKSDPETRHYRLAPLVWADSTPTSERKAAARAWRLQQSDSAKLLAASVLLFDEEQGKQSASDLRELSTSVNRFVHSLATAQLWRLRVDQANITRDELHRWQLRAQEMPEEVRGGPYYIVGTGYRLMREDDRAAASFLWLPLVYPDDTHLAARACVDAADSLVQCGQKTQATALYRETIQRFSATPAARSAAEALARMKPQDAESRPSAR